MHGRRRRRQEASIRVIDMIVYAVAVVGGFYAVLATPVSVVDVLEGAEWLVPVWASLLLVGGAVGFMGRLTRYWMVETPGTVLAFFGVLIFMVMLGRYAFTTITASVAALMAVTALLVYMRRWIELQMFASDPRDGSLSSRLALAIRRRTKNYPRHDA